MRIRKLHIEKYEALENCGLVLEDGVNIYYGENESGKTLIHTFIGHMLFDENLFSTCSGTMEFEKDGKTYLVCKRQGRHLINHKAYCIEEGKECSLSDVLDGLQKFDYENTVSIGQRKLGCNRENDLDYELQRAMATIAKLEQKIADVKERYSSLVQERENASFFFWRSWRVHPGMVILMMLLSIFIFTKLPSPSNYLIGVVVLLGEGIIVWNRMKVGQKRKGEHGEHESRNTIGKLKKKHVNLIMQLDEEIDSKDKVLEQVGIMNERASEIIHVITDGKYTKIFTDESQGTYLCREDQCIPIDQLSQSTRDQVYFSLRMAFAEGMQLGDYPLILDDTFCSYDDKRLEAVFRWLLEEKKQVLLFTSHKRERIILEELKKNIDKNVKIV